MSPVVEAVTEPVTLGEGPHWDHDEQALYFVSPFDHSINKYVPDTGIHTKAKLDSWVSFVIPIQGMRHHFVAGLNRKIGKIYWDGTDNSAEFISTVCELDQVILQNRFNDAKADPMGRLFAGTMGEEYEPGKFYTNKGSLYRIDSTGAGAGAMTMLAANIDMSNGLAWDLKEKAFYYIDSFQFGLRRYDYDEKTGNISNPRLVFECKDHGVGGVLDGMTIDTDGNVWIANFGGSQVLNIDPRTGVLLRRIPIPALQVTSVTFGGRDLDVMYVTTGALNREEEQTPPCGATFSVTGLGVKGHSGVKVQLV